MKPTSPRKQFSLKAILLFGIGAVLVLMLFTVGGISAWEYSNSDAFCTNACHAVHPEEPESHGVSSHARVHCVECHIGRMNTLHKMVLKTEHLHELTGMLTGYDRPLTSTTLRPARDSCERCHWPAAFHDDRVRDIHHYADDEKSTETTTRLIMHTGGGSARHGRGKGIHWHVENPIFFIATDPQRQKIPWVQLTRPDGSTVTYTDYTSKLSPEEIAGASRRQMDCMDCHNEVGHPFPNPEDLVDEAIYLGQIDRKLPFAKARAMEVINNAMKDNSKETLGRDDVDALIEKGKAEYRRSFPETTQDMTDSLTAAATAMEQILRRSVFQTAGVSWRLFPNNTGHKDFPGCFRCHNGKHLNESGESIRLHCNICHDIPVVSREGGPAPVPSTKDPNQEQPASHLKDNFIPEHSSMVNSSCEDCHDSSRFGDEGGNFCSNPACHGREWP